MVKYHLLNLLLLKYQSGDLAANGEFQLNLETSMGNNGTPLKFSEMIGVEPLDRNQRTRVAPNSLKLQSIKSWSLGLTLLKCQKAMAILTRL